MSGQAGAHLWGWVCRTGARTDREEEGLLWEVPVLCAGWAGTPELLTNASQAHRWPCLPDTPTSGHLCCSSRYAQAGAPKTPTFALFGRLWQCR